MFFLVLISLILITTVKAEENLYLYDSLKLKLSVEGGFELIAEEDGATIDSVRTELGLYPQDSIRQTLSDWSSSGEVEKDKVVFEWEDKKLEKKEYGFEAVVKTENKRGAVDKKVRFPLLSVEGYEEYLKATEHIDKNYPKIIEKATELAEGEDDLFKVVFKLAEWVEENIKYELTTLTAGTSQKASWVLEHRQGVCDEMTSLFIAMCRALGIPARFVSGVSYTSSELFKEKWLPHGWAEVYFPGYGWVELDIAFGEYGYIDVTHIKLREGADPAEAVSAFRWRGQNVDLKSDELKFSVEVKDKGRASEEEISLKMEILGEEIGLGSYNLIKGIIENKNDYYAAATLKLAVPKEVKITGKEKKTALLKPGEIKEIDWAVKVSDDLSEQYQYEFPVIIYSEKNVSIRGKFKAGEKGIFYSEEEIESLIPQDEEKSFLKMIALDCNYEKEIKLGEKKGIACVIKNKGNVYLEKVNFCLGKVCEIINLPINQEEELKTEIKAGEAGWQKLTASAQNEGTEKKIFLEYVVLDDPEISLEIKKPDTVNYREKFAISLRATPDSFSIPGKVKIILGGAGFENKWEMEELKREQEFSVELNSKDLGRKNKFKIKLLWEDKFGKKYEWGETILIKIEGKTIWEKTVLWLKEIVFLFY